MDRYLTTAEARDIARCSDRHLRTAYTSGALRAFQPAPGGRVLIRESDLLDWIEGRNAISAKA